MLEERKRYIIDFQDVPADRAHTPELAPDDRIKNYDEIEKGFTLEQAQSEAKRCLSCRRCLGCKLCLAGCPFDVPRFDEDCKISKCHLCSDRIANGLEPACSKTCPTGAIKYGSRDTLVAGAASDGYNIYGKSDLGGLGVVVAGISQWQKRDAGNLRPD